MTLSGNMRPSCTSQRSRAARTEEMRLSWNKAWPIQSEMITSTIGTTPSSTSSTLP